ncbi:hypothetical protein FRC07_012425 [Ceratobasidium sp. 392]|nr:hypothetical protein FRC07_012425 [Ceratobasidium sp. 392]
MLFYNSQSFLPSVLRVWSKSKEVREHTNLIVIQNPGDPQSRTVEKYSYAPQSTRPWGLDLPTPSSLCGCSDDGSAEQDRWKYDPRRKLNLNNLPLKFGEHFSVLTPNCRHTLLYVAVFFKDFKPLQISGTIVVKQAYRYDLGSFPLDLYSRFRMRYTKRRDNDETRLSHDKPWTRAGIEAWNASQNLSNGVESMVLD